MELRVEKLGPGRELIVAGGSLDWNATPALKDTFDKMFERNVYQIIFDGSGVSYISSSAFGVLVEAMNMTKTAAGRLVFLKPSEAILELCGLLGATHLFAIADSKDAALKLLK
jgi:anti-anti-sigma factor